MGVVGKTGLSWNADAAVLLGASKPLFEKGRRTVLVGHSYGGVPACAAADRPGGGFSHLAAFPMPARGMSVLSVCGGGWLPWYEVVELEGGGKQLFVNEKARDLLYNDLSPEKARAVFSALVRCSYEAFTAGVDVAVPNVTIHMTFIVCEDDALFPLNQLQSLAATCGPDVNVVAVRRGHGAFASVPDEALVRIYGGYPGK